MGCPICGMPPRDGEPCCTKKYAATIIRNQDASIASLKSEVEELRRDCTEAGEDVRHLVHTNSALKAEVADLKAKQEQLVTALRGGTGITFSEDGYTVNVTMLREKAALADEIAPRLRTGHAWEDWLTRYAALDELNKDKK